MPLYYFLVAKQSSGILPYRKTDGGFEFFLVHPGGPFFAKKDIGAWSIPKGEFTTEDPLEAARREFKEETSISIDSIPKDNFITLDNQTLKSGKVIFAFGLEIDINPKTIKSNTFTIGSKSFPEIDRGQWFRPNEALLKINPGMIGLINQLLTVL